MIGKGVSLPFPHGHGFRPRKSYPAEKCGNQRAWAQEFLDWIGSSRALVGWTLWQVLLQVFCFPNSVKERGEVTLAHMRIGERRINVYDKAFGPHIVWDLLEVQVLWQRDHCQLPLRTGNSACAGVSKCFDIFWGLLPFAWCWEISSLRSQRFL